MALKKEKLEVINPRTLLDDIWGLMKANIESIKMTGSPQYGEDVSNILVRYASALTGGAKDFDEDAAREAKKLSKLTKEELKEKTLKYLQDL